MQEEILFRVKLRQASFRRLFIIGGQFGFVKDLAEEKMLHGWRRVFIFMIKILYN